MMGRQFVKTLKEHGYVVAVAESCTGGMIASAITSVPGSSEIFDRGFVTYSNQAKQEMLGVAASLLKKHGAVSAEVAVAMARGALKNSQANVAIATTGIAGPGGGTPEKPVGLVFIAGVVRGQRPFHVRCNFGNLSRATIRKMTTDSAIGMLEALTLRDETRPRSSRKKV